jgi:murein DD-endopeptidase MepM/ murein hydrolase activator NlpD
MTRSRVRAAMPIALVASFVAGALVDGWLRTYGPPRPVQGEESRHSPDGPATAAGLSASPAPQAPAKARTSATLPTGAATPPPEGGQPGSSGIAATNGELPQTRLRVPIDGLNIETLKGAFSETRDGSRPHEAADMLAPRNTPIHAVENGTIAKLFTSKAGGLTIYQFDPSGRLCYYYAHLERYAEGLKDGQAVSQGDVIGYVGTTGNAPANTPHLHFAVFELNADKHWWEGKPLDPYQLLKDRS